MTPMVSTAGPLSVRSTARKESARTGGGRTNIFGAASEGSLAVDASPHVRAKRRSQSGRGGGAAAADGWRAWLARTLNGASPQSWLYELLATLLVVLSVAVHVLSPSPDAARARALERLDGAVSGLFLLDYLARALTAPDASWRCRALGPVRGRLRWCGTWEALVDAGAAFPWFVERPRAPVAAVGDEAEAPSPPPLRSLSGSSTARSARE